MIIADSDVLIDALRGRQPAADRIALELKTGDLATTAISAFELLSGTRSDRQRRKVEALLGAVKTIPLSEDASRRAAAVRRDLEAEGKGIGMADYLIAGICLERSAILITRNRKHFERVPNLTLSHE